MINLKVIHVHDIVCTEDCAFIPSFCLTRLFFTRLACVYIRVLEYYRHLLIHATKGIQRGAAIKTCFQQLSK